nr:GGDEF domain-containing protein [Alkalicoccus urumqiensis]
MVVHVQNNSLSLDSLYQEYQKLAAVIEHLHTSVVLTDPHTPDNPIVFINPAFTTLTQYTKEEAMGRNCRFLQGEDTSRETIEKIKTAVSRHESITVELKNYRKDGTPFWNEVRISPVYDEDGELIYYIGLQADVTERRHYQDSIQYHATHDELTGLPNRKKLMETVKAHLTEKKPFTLLFIDLDSFKEINDTYGHLAGDDVLQKTAGVLEQTAAAGGGSAARISGDEFVMLLPSSLGEDESIVCVDRVQKAVTQTVQLDDTTVQVEASIGASRFPEDGTTFEALLRNADHAMYRAKRSKA